MPRKAKEKIEKLNIIEKEKQVKKSIGKKATKVDNSYSSNTKTRQFITSNIIHITNCCQHCHY